MCYKKGAFMPPLLLSIVLPNIETSLLGEVFSFDGAKVYGDDVLKKVDRKIVAWMCSADANNRVLHGAFPFGADNNFDRKVDYLTVVSHPVRRGLDEFALISRKNKHPLYKMAKASGGDVSAFLKSSKAASMLNAHTVALAGPDGKDLDTRDPKLLEMALENLATRFQWVGCAESLDTHLKELEGLLGMSLVLTSVPPAESHAAIEAANALDTELYRICRDGGWRK